MFIIQQSVTIERPIGQVFAFLADPANIPHWRPDVLEVRSGGGPLHAGSEFDELINVGGEKVYPAEVESVLCTMPGVQSVTVSGEPNPITGQIVTARVKLDNSEPLSAFRKRMFEHCKNALPRFKIPQKVVIVSEDMHGERFKTVRSGSS